MLQAPFFFFTLMWGQTKSEGTNYFHSPCIFLKNCFHSRTKKLFQEEILIVVVVVNAVMQSCLRSQETAVWQVTPEVTSNRKCLNHRSSIYHSGCCKGAVLKQTTGWTPWTPKQHDHNLSNLHDLLKLCLVFCHIQTSYCLSYWQLGASRCANHLK